MKAFFSLAIVTYELLLEPLHRERHALRFSHRSLCSHFFSLSAHGSEIPDEIVRTHHLAVGEAVILLPPPLNPN